MVSLDDASDGYPTERMEFIEQEKKYKYYDFGDRIGGPVVRLRYDSSQRGKGSENRDC